MPTSIHFLPALYNYSNHGELTTLKHIYLWMLAFIQVIVITKSSGRGNWTQAQVPRVKKSLQNKMFILFLRFKLLDLICNAPLVCRSHNGHIKHFCILWHHGNLQFKLPDIFNYELKWVSKCQSNSLLMCEWRHRAGLHILSCCLSAAAKLSCGWSLQDSSTVWWSNSQTRTEFHFRGIKWNQCCLWRIWRIFGFNKKNVGTVIFLLLVHKERKLA